MASERIPACAYYLVDNAAPHVAALIPKLRLETRQNWDSFLAQAYDSCRASLSPRRIRAIMGQLPDNWTQEAYVSAVRLHNEAIAIAVQDRRIWDRRRSARTRRNILHSGAISHIWKWAETRGMDLAEVLRLRDEGGEK